MELTESIETINQRLIDYYGKFENNQPNFRVVFANDQTEIVDGVFEKRTPEGLFLAVEYGVREVPKYYNSRDKYILERLTPVPTGSRIVTPLSYEPVWTFQDSKGNYLPPDWLAIKMIIDVIQENIARALNGGSSVPKYKDPDVNPETEQIRLKQTYDSLYGNETAVTDALMHDHGVGYGVRRRNS